MAQDTGAVCSTQCEVSDINHVAFTEDLWRLLALADSR